MGRKRGGRCERGGRGSGRPCDAKWLQFCTKDLADLYEWELVSELGSQFTKSNKPSGGEVEGAHDDGCNVRAPSPPSSSFSSSTYTDPHRS